jgi:hypothetical protein
VTIKWSAQIVVLDNETKRYTTRHASSELFADIVKDFTAKTPLVYPEDDVHGRRIQSAVGAINKNQTRFDFNEKAVLKQLANKYTRTLSAATSDSTISHKDMKLLIGRMFTLTL